ncbi:MAG: type II toxin-antitoxin system VapC family toxin [Mariprofundus sp.]|nr:type II toxin-antitoxin system VapC family toxin [Mariprofundus sp.]
MLVYLDTSALAKWYLNEAGSDFFVDWVTKQDDIHISSLTVTEMRCLLARRKRMDEITPELERQIFAIFSEDIERGYLSRHALLDQHAINAISLIDQLPQIALRTLDAMHLAVARQIGADAIATADKVMISAARSLDMEVFPFVR